MVVEPVFIATASECDCQWNRSKFVDFTTGGGNWETQMGLPKVRSKHGNPLAATIPCVVRTGTATLAEID